MKVLVTGTNGLLGSEVVLALKERGHKCISLVGDISDASLVAEQLREQKPDAVVHTAAMTDVKKCEAEPERAHAVNALGTKYLVEAAKALDVPIIYISTVSVFSGNGNFKEEEEPNPLNVYNKTKREGEEYVLKYEKGLVARINIIGIPQSGSRGRSLVEWLVDSAQENKDMTLYTNARINPLSSITLAGYLVKLLENPPSYNIIHLGSSDIVSKADIGDMVLAHFSEYTGTVRESEQPASSTQPTEMWLNVERATEFFGRLPSVSEEAEKIITQFCKGGVS